MTGPLFLYRPQGESTAAMDSRPVRLIRVNSAAESRLDPVWDLQPDGWVLFGSLLICNHEVAHEHRPYREEDSPARARPRRSVRTSKGGTWWRP